MSGYDEIHAIHAGMFAAASPAAGGGSRYEIEHTRRVADDVALAYVRRFSQAEPTEERPGRADAFDELAADGRSSAVTGAGGWRPPFIRPTGESVRLSVMRAEGDRRPQGLRGTTGGAPHH